MVLTPTTPLSCCVMRYRTYRTCVVRAGHPCPLDFRASESNPCLRPSHHSAPLFFGYRKACQRTLHSASGSSGPSYGSVYTQLLKARNFHMASGQWLRPGQSFNFMEATPSAGTALPAPFQTTGHTSVHNNSLHFFLGAASLKPSIQLMAQKSWAKFS